mmetsp:Transcript_23027/g.39022  ORF Transcript_23027/g.39022 Transcript_23027/m.39022 type:complete len:841 (+) Transcript_23027:1218-3740(+)
MGDVGHCAEGADAAGWHLYRGLAHIDRAADLSAAPQRPIDTNRAIDRAGIKLGIRHRHICDVDAHVGGVTARQSDGPGDLNRAALCHACPQVQHRLSAVQADRAADIVKGERQVRRGETGAPGCDLPLDRGQGGRAIHCEVKGGNAQDIAGPQDRVGEAQLCLPIGLQRQLTIVAHAARHAGLGARRAIDIGVDLEAVCNLGGRAAYRRRPGDARHQPCDVRHGQRILRGGLPVREGQRDVARAAVGPCDLRCHPPAPRHLLHRPVQHEGTGHLRHHRGDVGHLHAVICGQRLGGKTAVHLRGAVQGAVDVCTKSPVAIALYGVGHDPCGAVQLRNQRIDVRDVRRQVQRGPVRCYDGGNGRRSIQGARGVGLDRPGVAPLFGGAVQLHGAGQRIGDQSHITQPQIKARLRSLAGQRRTGIRAEGGIAQAQTLHNHAALVPTGKQIDLQAASQEGIGLWHANGQILRCPGDLYVEKTTQGSGPRGREPSFAIQFDTGQPGKGRQIAGRQLRVKARVETVTEPVDLRGTPQRPFRPGQCHVRQGQRRVLDIVQIQPTAYHLSDGAGQRRIGKAEACAVKIDACGDRPNCIHIAAQRPVDDQLEVLGADILRVQRRDFDNGRQCVACRRVKAYGQIGAVDPHRRTGPWQQYRRAIGGGNRALDIQKRRPRIGVQRRLAAQRERACAQVKVVQSDGTGCISRPARGQPHIGAKERGIFGQKEGRDIACKVCVKRGCIVIACAQAQRAVQPGGIVGSQGQGRRKIAQITVARKLEVEAWTVGYVQQARDHSARRFDKVKFQRQRAGVIGKAARHIERGRLPIRPGCVQGDIARTTGQLGVARQG